MDIQDLKCFIAIYKYKNFTKASEILHISQPALSRRIITLEEEIGVTLFVRGSRYVDLTTAGERFLIDAEKIIQRHNRLLTDLEFYKDTGGIRIGFTPSMYIQGLLEVVTLTRKVAPEVNLQFRAGTMSGNIQKLLQNEIDIAYTMYGEVEDLHDITNIKLIENDLSVIIPKGHRLWSSNYVTCEELEGENFAIQRDSEIDAYTATKTINWLEKRLRSIEKISFLRSQSEVLLFVCSGQGIGLNGLYVNDSVKRETKYFKNIVINNAKIPYGDLVLAYGKDNAQAIEFVKFISENKNL